MKDLGVLIRQVRKRRSPVEKRLIVEEALEPGASVARVARAHGLNANVVFHWRSLYREGKLAPEPAGAMKLLPVSIAEHGVAERQPEELIAPKIGSIRIKLAGGLCCVNRARAVRGKDCFMFKRCRLPVAILLLCVRWYCKYGISYRDDAGAWCGSGPNHNHAWIHRYAPKLEKRVRRLQGYGSTPWRVDETYIRVGGRWRYLYRPVDKHGVLIGFMPLERRNTRAVQRFLSKALTTMREWPPSSITTDKLRSCPEAIERLEREGKLSSSTRHRTSKYLNNIIEADHGALKQLIRPTRGFQTMKTATATIKGFEIIRMIRRGQCLTCERGAKNEVRFVNSLFELAA